MAEARPFRSIPGPPNGLIGWSHLRRFQRDLLEFSCELAEQHGDIVRLRFGTSPFVQVASPELCHEILVRRAKSFHKSARTRKVLGRWNGKNLVFSEGAFWARQRRLVQQAFHPRVIASHAELVAQQVEALLAEHGAGRSFDMAPAISRVTLNVVAQALFGADVSAIADRFTDEVSVLQDLALQDILSPIIWPIWFPLPRYRRLRQAVKFLDSTVYGFIRQRRAAPDTTRNDLLSIMLQAVDEEQDGGVMTDRQARDESMGLLLGGNETTATSITWALVLLARHPEWQDAIREEAEGLPDPLTAAELPRLGATQRVLKEAMRLYPAVYATAREAIEEVELGGYRIPRGCAVQLLFYRVHRDPRWHPDPLRFDPDRFLPESEAQMAPGAYLPFGLGPRACIGKGMAMMEGTLVLASLLRRHRVRLAPGQGEVETEAQISLHPKGGVQMRLEATGNGRAEAHGAEDKQQAGPATDERN